MWFKANSVRVSVPGAVRCVVEYFEGEGSQNGFCTVEEFYPSDKSATCISTPDGDVFSSDLDLSGVQELSFYDEHQSRIAHVVF